MRYCCGRFVSFFSAHYHSCGWLYRAVFWIKSYAFVFVVVDVAATAVAVNIVRQKHKQSTYLLELADSFA